MPEPVPPTAHRALHGTAAVGQTLSLEGRAYDADQGTMTDSQLTWTSSLNGALGTGAQLSVSELSAGTHTITLQAEDGQGGTASTSVQVQLSRILRSYLLFPMHLSPAHPALPLARQSVRHVKQSRSITRTARNQLPGTPVQAHHGSH